MVSKWWWWRCPSPDVVAGGGRGGRGDDQCYKIIVLSIVSVADSSVVEHRSVRSLTQLRSSQSSYDGQSSHISASTRPKLNV